MDNPAPEQLNPPQTVPAATFREPITRIAAWWHTVLVLLLLAAWAIIGALRVEKLRTLAITHRRWFYARSMLTEWAVLAIVLFGVWLHKSPFAAVLGERWKSAAQIWRDFKVSVAFWFAAVAILIFLGLQLRAVPNGPGIKFLLPHGGIEKLLWLGVSVSAGICEEAIFRGYLQRQFLAMTHSAPVSIVLTGTLFGGMHAYQGLRGVITIGALGLMLGILAHWRGTVRPGMFAHAWQDALPGLLSHLFRG